MTILINNNYTIAVFLTVIVALSWIENDSPYTRHLYYFNNNSKFQYYMYWDTLPFDIGLHSYGKEISLPFDDGINSVSIYELYSEHGVPIGYTRNINTHVCNTGECLPIEVNLYWNIAGRYVGYELPGNEILTKLDHIPFSKYDYEKLDRLLADQQSILGAYEIDDLVQPIDSSEDRIDGVTSATIQVVNDICVVGAVYTCFTLWHIVNGHTSRFIAKRADKTMTPDAGLYLVQEGNLSDISWLLNHFDLKAEEYSELKETLINRVTPENYFVTGHIFQVLTGSDLKIISIQNSLLNKFRDTPDFNIKYQILTKLIEVENLEPQVVSYFADNLLNLPAVLQAKVIKLFDTQCTINNSIIEQVKKLLESDNQFIVNEAWGYLKKHE